LPAIWRLTALVLVVAAAPGCQFPRDPDATLDRVKGGVVRVGVGQRMPWAGWEGDRPVGAEIELVQEMAERLHARVQWTRGSDEELLHALEKRAIDLVAAGLEARSPWAAKVSFTRAFLHSRLVLAVAPGVKPPGRLDGATVAASPDGVDAALLREHGAHVVPEDRHDVAVLVEDWEIGPGLRPAHIKIENEKHVLALPLGENAWLLEVNRLLAGSTPRARKALERIQSEGSAGSG
jgi:polar amino acid transport system substrate-binding protein